MDTNPSPLVAELSIELDAALLAAIRSIAEQEGRPMEAVVENALGDFVSKTRDSRRELAWRYYQESVEKYGELYRLLAQ